MQSLNGSFKNVKGRLKKVYEKMETVENWMKTVLFVCVAALAIDPLFFFILVVDSHGFCLTFDKKLGAAVCVMRTLIDTFYVIHITFHFITEIIVPRSQLSWRGELIVQSSAIRKRRFVFHFIVDIVSVLPVPQVVILTSISRKRHVDSLVSKEILKWIILTQYIPRIIRIYPHYKEVTKDSGTVAETRWIGAALNFFLYMLQSHVFGAFWYLGAIEKRDRCWREACAKTPGCDLSKLFCSRGGLNNNHFLYNSCPLIDPDAITNSTVFNFGMYINALKSGVIESKDFPRKFFHCFWWGLRNLSALGQNLETSNSVGEIFFAITICVSGMLLFAVLIGNVQKYLQPLTIRVDEMEEKKRDIEKWMSNRRLPEDLKKRIRKYENYKWRETRGTEEDALLRSLPKDLRVEAKRHLYLKFLKRVPVLGFFDDRLLEELCTRSKIILYTENSYIVREGDRVEEMLFIVRGNLIGTTKYGCPVQFRAGDFCGESIISWALVQPHTSHVPISSTTVKTLTEVEGLVLSADDLKSVTTQYSHLYQSREIKHMFRFYSAQWRTWAACFIQAAWRRHCKKKLSKALREEEGNLHNIHLHNEGGNKLNLAATFYASMFASHALKSKSECNRSNSSSTRL